MQTRPTYRVAKEELNFQFTLQEKETKCCVHVYWQKRAGFSIPSLGKKGNAVESACQITRELAGCSIRSSGITKSFCQHIWWQGGCMVSFSIRFSRTCIYGWIFNPLFGKRKLSASLKAKRLVQLDFSSAPRTN